MIRSGIASAVVGLVALFAYFLLTDKSARTGTEKARDAVARVADTVVEQGVAATVRVALLAELKHDARFLHVYHTDARVLVYGLLPDTLRVEAVTAVARKVPGVQEVEVLVWPPPAYVIAPEAGPATAP